ncbi:MAG TPA: zinc ribbon domain-containing protein, partial [Cytophagaceae bacterium]|nr:zinc ribbon domain-containing protein [Cytophagaceae bacterium]
YKGFIKIEEWKNEPEEVVKGLHEAIIDEQLFGRVQNILLKKNKNAAKPSKYQPLFPLRGHLICKQCGCLLTASSSKGRSKKYDYYHCQHGCKERTEAAVINSSFIVHLSSLQIDKQIALVYKEVIKDVYHQEEGSKESQIAGFSRNITSLTEKQKKLDDKFISDVISGDDYKRMSIQLKTDLEKLKQEKEIMENAETNFQKHFSSGISFLSDLVYYYDLAPIELKHRMIDSIYPEKLIFDGIKYRTTKINSFVDLIASKSIKIDVKQKRQAIFSDDLSKVAPPLGLEPRTP